MKNRLMASGSNKFNELGRCENGWADMLMTTEGEGSADNATMFTDPEEAQHITHQSS